MINRKPKIKELLDDMIPMQKNMNFRGLNITNMPRITPAQMGVIMFIDKHNSASVKDIATALCTTSSAITQLVNELVDNGYLNRETRLEDHRVVTLTISKKIKGQLKIIKERVIESFIKKFEVLTDREFNQYIALQNKIIKGFSDKK